MRPNGVWNPEVLTCSALNNSGVAEVWELVQRYVETMQKANAFTAKRAGQNLDWMQKLIYETIELRMQGDTSIKTLRAELERAVQRGEITPLAAAQRITDQL